MTKNLWGEIPEYLTIRTPLSVLKEQASVITELTNGSIKGRVETSGNKIELILQSQSWVGGNYTVFRAEVNSPEDPYPVKTAIASLSSIEKFEEFLELVLQSEKTRQAIAVLLANSMP